VFICVQNFIWVPLPSLSPSNHKHRIEFCLFYCDISPFFFWLSEILLFQSWKTLNIYEWHAHVDRKLLLLGQEWPCGKRLRWSRGSALAFGTQVPRRWVQTRPKPSNFFRAKKSSARRPSEGKQSRRSHVVDLRHVKEPWMLCGSRAFRAKFIGHFSPI
jgi:hypothetical protein